MSSIDRFLVLVERYCAAASIAEATLSTKLFNDGKRLSIIRDGGDLGTRHFERSVQWFSDNWPASAEWPSEIERPFSSSGASEDAA